MKLVMISINDRGNLGARILVAQAKRLGHEAALVNYGEYHHETYRFSEGADSPSFGILMQLLPTLRPDVIGISYRSAMAYLAPGIALAARSVCFDAPIVAGGIGATSDPAAALRWADAVCYGEGDAVLPDILAGKAFDTIPGVLVAERDGRPDMHEHVDHFGDGPALQEGYDNLPSPGPAHQWPRHPAPLCEDLDACPFPDYEGETTWTLVSGELIHPDGRLDNDIGAYPLLTSRGCPRACSYCHNSTVHALYKGRRYPRQRSVEHVMDEIARAVRTWNVKLLSIYDDLFVADPEWVFRFCRELPRVWPTNRRFWCMTHPAYVRDDVIAALYSAGLEEVCLGVQSGSDRILHIYRRGTTRDEILAACRILAQYPIGVKIDIISANPVEFLDDRLATMDLIQRMPRNPRWKPGLSRLTVFPGSGISRFVTQAQCEETHGDYQDFVDGLYRGAFVPRWYPIDLVDAMRRYVDFRAFRAARPWPDPAGPLSDEFWLPLSTWLDEGAPR